MPELPDIAVYVEAVARRIVGARLERVRVRGVSVLRTVEPAAETVEGRRVLGVERIGKRIVLAFEDDLFVVLHLMIAGRLRWRETAESGQRTAGTKKGIGRIAGASRIEQVSFEFENGVLTLTEAGTKKRAALHVVRGRGALRAFDRGGLDVLTCGAAAFGERLRRENRTLKRALTDPTLFDGIGNACSDEILHAARLSPMQHTGRLADAEAARLLEAARGTLAQWTDALFREFGLSSPHDTGGEPPGAPAPSIGRFPGVGEITAFRPDFAVHGKFGKPCPACGTAVQRIVFAENECNYCPRCQTGGRVLADRSMSRLMKDDWPRTIEELEGEA